MRARLLLTAIVGPLPIAMAPALLKAHAAPASMCGAGIVETAICLDWWMKRSEHTALVAKAHAGDVRAASILANFHSLAGEEAIGRRWRLLAAERGDCWSIETLRDIAQERGDRATTRKWNTRLRWNRCKPAMLAK